MTLAPTRGLRRERLPNGVTLLVQRRDVAPAAALVAHVRAGFLDEPDALVGVSHVLEHMLFKGTATLGPGELAQRTKALGGALNAYTSYDRTVYYASAPVRHANELMALQADQVRNSQLDGDELRRELGVIIQEARRKLDSPGAVASETLHELLYREHRLRRWRIGTEPMLERFTRDDVANYYASRYVPTRVIVSFVADMDEDAALDALRAHWGDWQAAAVDIPPGPAERSVATVQTRRLSGDVALGEIVLGWRGPGVLDADVPALDVAAAILGIGHAARFARVLREPGLANSVGVSSYGVADTGVFSIGVELDPVRLPRVLEVVGENLADLAGREPSGPEFDRALTMLRARLGRRLEGYESRAIALADAESLGDVTLLDREESDLLAVTPGAVRAAVRRWLVPDGVSAVAYLPRASEIPFETAMLTGAMHRPRPVRPVSTEIDTAVVHHRALANLDILTARFGGTGQVALSVYRPRPLAATPATAGLAALTIRSMMRGTVRLDAGQLAFAMESLGGSISPSLGPDLMGFGATILSENVAAAAALLAEVLLQPRFDPGQIAIEKNLLLDDTRAVADDMVRFPMQLALGVAFNDTGYGSPVLGTPESVATFDAVSVRNWHSGILGAERTTVIAVGDADPDRLADQLARAFSPAVHELTGADLAASADSFAIIPGQRSESRDRKQSALAMLFPGPSRNDPDRFAAETWGAIAAGLGGRLFESLRSARSLAYTVIANSWQRRRAGGLLTYIATDPERLAEARDAMLEELQAFRQQAPSPEEVSRATAMLAGHAEMSRQTAGAFAGEIADAWLLGGGLSELDDPAAPYRAVTADAVFAVVARALDPALRAEGVVAAAAAE